MNKDVKQLVRSIEHIEGVELRNTQNGHLAVYKNDKFITTIAMTPSDHHWRENTMAPLRRAGITPSVHPKGPSRQMQNLLAVKEIKRRVKALPNRAEFARFLVLDMPKLQPELRTYKNVDSAASSLHEMTKATSSAGLRGWTHLLLDQAVREWEARLLAETASELSQNGQDANATEAELVVESPITDEEIDEAIASDMARIAEGDGIEKTGIEAPADGTEVELPAEEPEPVSKLATMSMVDLARDHEELTGRIDKLAEYVRSRKAQLEEMVTRREALSTEILSRLSDSESRS